MSKNLQISLFYIIGFLILYLEPIYIGGIKFSVAWKILLVIYLLVVIFLLKIKRPKMEVFILFSFLLAFKTLFSFTSFEAISTTMSLLTKALMFPLLFLFFKRWKKKRLNMFALHFSILIILSFIPFLLGILSPLSKGYELYSYGFQGQFGLIGVFQNPHSASISLSFALIVLYWFLKKEENKKKRIYYFMLILIGIYLLVFTYVRTGIAIFVIAFIYLKIKEKYSVKKYIYGLSLILSLIGISIYLYTTNEAIQMRITGNNIYNSTDGKIGSGRLQFMGYAYENLTEEGFAVSMIGLGFDYALYKMGKDVGHEIFAHNGYIQIFQQEGLIGLVIFILFLFYYIKFILKHKNNKYYLINMALLLAFLVEYLFQGGFYFNMILLMVIFLALMKIEKKEQKIKSDNHKDTLTK